MTDAAPESRTAKQPFDWGRMIPDTRSLVTLGILALAWRMLEMIDSEPKLLENPAFMTLATLVLGGSGLGMAVAYFYGSSRSADKQTADTVATLTSAVANSNPPPSPTSPVFDTGAPTPKPDPNFPQPASSGATL